MGTSHKPSGRLTPRLRKRAFSGWKLVCEHPFLVDAGVFIVLTFYAERIVGEAGLLAEDEVLDDAQEFVGVDRTAGDEGVDVDDFADGLCCRRLRPPCG